MDPRNFKLKLVSSARNSTSLQHDPDASLRQRQPTAERCRLFHGIGCSRGCANTPPASRVLHLGDEVQVLQPLIALRLGDGQSVAISPRLLGPIRADFAPDDDHTRWLRARLPALT